MAHLASILTQATGLLLQAMTLLELADKNAADDPDNAGHRATAKKLIKDAAEQLTTATQNHPALNHQATATVQGLRASIPVPIERDP